ncbi:enoyl-CoA hydratase/isomerase family protein [Rhizobacter sp. Root404]|uniref:enoyl-CoA hydratase/isomerase family protein n=1 Tax=Rhizobacter sp. Root404 TaxID=1736528 RepID=UPI0006F5738B|nr:enoyl-CoA hydratase/isomerase family protein [Rhizobacter sp. Root404]KQW39206.1 enoyl-CoA hydratase [Rhizobacter sp. Root404]
MSDYKTLEVEIQGPVGTVRMNRPAAANGIDLVMASELAQVAATLDAEGSIRAVILTGTGKFFSAGGDLKQMGALEPGAGLRVKRMADDVHRAISIFSRMKAPLVVAVNGVAAGGGFSLALCGDIVLAAQSATFTMAYSKAGLSPDGSSTYFLPRLIGLRKTQDLMFTNRKLSSQQALEWGLVHEVIPDAELAVTAFDLASRLASGASGSHKAMKKLLLATWGNGLETQMELEGRYIASMAGSEEGREGITAFIEKRLPKFR